MFCSWPVAVCICVHVRVSHRMFGWKKSQSVLSLIFGCEWIDIVLFFKVSNRNQKMKTEKKNSLNDRTMEGG